ncbi:MAG TPA: hypothetical protein VMS17_04900 [Gemmataceae bacterium]|nr:hypothetical protein [Gemmataceae bacterium]
MSEITKSDRFAAMEQAMRHPPEQRQGLGAGGWLVVGLAAAALGWLVWSQVGKDLIRYIKISTM